MKTSTKTIIITLVVGVVGFLTESNGPLGTFWRPDSMVPIATGIQLPLFMILGLSEALALGLGISFFLFGYSTLKAQPGVSPGLARAAHLSITWVLANWWAHDSFHIHNGMNLNGLLGIEYGFHMTLIMSGVVMAKYFVAATRAPAVS